MRLSGRVSEEERQQYVLIDGEEDAEIPSNVPTGVYDLTPEERSQLSKLAGDGGALLSENMMTTKRFFTRASRNKRTGKLEVWRGESVETAKTVSSIVKILSGPCVNSVGQARHFLSCKVADKTHELVSINLFLSSVHCDADSGLSWIDTTNKENKVILAENISRPIVTAIDESNGSILWLLNYK